mmetsp:Transcript_29454/g.85867  ORF Transcript_29454/g.85867 Transcript_29454/m.85867 type:complete len:381 (-) Transcript_29454:2403-3545(-)
MEPTEVEVAHVHPAAQDLALVRVVEPLEQLERGGLAGAAGPDQPHMHARFELEAVVAAHLQVWPTWVGEVHVFESGSPWHWHRLCSSRCRRVNAADAIKETKDVGDGADGFLGVSGAFRGRCDPKEAKEEHHQGSDKVLEIEAIHVRDDPAAPPEEHGPAPVLDAYGGGKGSGLDEQAPRVAFRNGSHHGLVTPREVALEPEGEHSLDGIQCLAQESPGLRRVVVQLLLGAKAHRSLQHHGRDEERQDAQPHKGNGPGVEERDSDPRDAGEESDGDPHQRLPSLGADQCGVRGEARSDGANTVRRHVEVAHLLAEIGGEHEIPQALRKPLCCGAKGVEHRNVAQDHHTDEPGPHQVQLHGFLPEVVSLRFVVLVTSGEVA